MMLVGSSKFKKSDVIERLIIDSGCTLIMAAVIALWSCMLHHIELLRQFPPLMQLRSFGAGLAEEETWKAWPEIGGQ